MMQRNTLIRTTLALGVALTLAGCVQDGGYTARTAPTYESAIQNPFIDSSKQAVTALLAGWDAASVSDSQVLVATVVDVNQLGRSSALGRTLSEMYASQLASRGVNVKELKLRGSVFVQEGTGELLLSREIQHIAKNHSAAVVLVGTYSQAARYTYVSLKLVRAADSTILRSHDYALPNDSDVLRLLSSARPASN